MACTRRRSLAVRIPLLTSPILRQRIDLTALAGAVAHEAIAGSGRAIAASIGPLPPCDGEAALLNQVLVNSFARASTSAPASATANTSGDKPVETA